MTLIFKVIFCTIGIGICGYGSKTVLYQDLV